MGKIIDIATGRLKQAVGDLTGNQRLEREGTADILKGKVEGATKEIIHAAQDAKHAVKHAGKKLP
jgi:uncharacterized protein YjbJ (UPF0337 family)